VKNSSDISKKEFKNALLKNQTAKPPIDEIKAKKKADTIVFVAAILSFTMVMLSCIFLLQAPTYVLIIAFILFIGLAATIAFINPIKFGAAFKLLFVILVASAVVFTTYLILHSTGVLARLENAAQIAVAIRSLGFWAAFIFILFCILNTVFLPIPLAVPAVVGALVFGPLLSFIYMSIGTVIGSLIVFTIGKKFGKRIVVWMIGKEKTEKYSALINKKGKLAFIFMMIFPFFPDDILCLVAGLSNMSYKFFLFVICPIRIGVLALASFFAGGAIIPFSGWGIPVWIVLGVLFVAAFIIITVLRARKNKHKRTTKAV